MNIPAISRKTWLNKLGYPEIVYRGFQNCIVTGLVVFIKELKSRKKDTEIKK